MSKRSRTSPPKRVQLVSILSPSGVVESNPKARLKRPRKPKSRSTGTSVAAKGYASSPKLAIGAAANLYGLSASPIGSLYLKRRLPMSMLTDTPTSVRRAASRAASPALFDGSGAGSGFASVLSSGWGGGGSSGFAAALSLASAAADVSVVAGAGCFALPLPRLAGAADTTCETSTSAATNGRPRAKKRLWPISELGEHAVDRSARSDLIVQLRVGQADALTEGLGDGSQTLTRGQIPAVGSVAGLGVDIRRMAAGKDASDDRTFEAFADHQRHRVRGVVSAAVQ